MLQNGEIWEQIRMEYLAGNSPTEIAKKYNVSRSAIYKNANKHGWKKMREEITQAADKRVAETIVTVAEKLAGIESRLLDDLCGMLETLEPRWAVKVTPADVQMIDRITRSTIALHDKLMPQERETVKIEVGEELRELGK